MPSTTEKQRRFMGAELERLREGRRTRTGMSERQLEDFAKKRRVEPDHANGRRHASRLTATTMLLRRLRFGSEWL